MCFGACTKADLSNAAFRWLTGKEIEVAGVAGVRALRVNYVGELGWELHVPMSGMPRVFDALMKAGEPHGIKLFGTYAMNCAPHGEGLSRLGRRNSPARVDMFEASMDRFIRLDKEDFIGRAASLWLKQRGPAHQARLYGSRCQPTTMPAATSPSIPMARSSASRRPAPMASRSKKSLAFAYVEPKLAKDGEEFEIMMLGEMRKARIIPEPAWDAKNERLKG